MCGPLERWVKPAHGCACRERKDIKLALTGVVWWVALIMVVSTAEERKDVKFTLTGVVWWVALKRGQLVGRSNRKGICHFSLAGPPFILSGFAREVSITYSDRNLLPCSYQDVDQPLVTF
jgi:hypothetical protein